MADHQIRRVTAADIAALKGIVDSCGIFPSAYLEGMMADYLGNPETEELWFIYVQDDVPLGFGYCVPEKLTDGTYNLLAIGVDQAAQGKGIGSKLMRYIEDELRQQGKRILIVDTSSSEDFALTRAFYTKAGYTEVATIKDFWKDGEDKITFYKRLA